MRRLLLTVVAMFLVFGPLACVTDAEEEEDEVGTDDSALRKKNLPETLKRVAIGRLFQHDEWVIPATEGQPGTREAVMQRRVAYVCSAFAKLDPTYVSGLVRVDADEALSPEMIATNKAVRKCLRDETKRRVRFDVVLNTRHYTSGDALRKRLAEVTDAFGPDIVFFDFYDDPFNVPEASQNRGALVAGIEWIHAHGMLVAGNVSSRKASAKLPPKTDFVAVKYGNQGFDGLKAILDVIPDSMPVLMHIQNDPQIDGSAGLKWMNGTRQERVSLLDQHASREKRLGYTYMYPVFFPLKQIKAPGKPTQTVAYDADADNLLYRMRTLIRP